MLRCGAVPVVTESQLFVSERHGFSPPTLQEAGPSIKRTKTSDDSGLDMDNAAENGGGDSVNDGGASEIELVFRPHPTLMEKDDGHNRWRLRPLSLLCPV